jgi:hypothetical protein
MTVTGAARWQTYVGLFMVALATLMYEILLTRIFSVTMWYHFAFMAISVAMFGMTVGALLVYIFPAFFTPQRAERHLALSSLLFAAAIIISFLTHLAVPVFVDRNLLTLSGLYALTLTYVSLSLPFIFSGIAVSLALTQFPRNISRLYAADLAGAALGCILLRYVLDVTDGPMTVFLVAFLACTAALVFALGLGGKLFRISAICALMLLAFVIVGSVQSRKQSPLVRLTWVRGELESPSQYEKWNSFSRVRVWGNQRRLEAPFGWGYSSTLPDNLKISQLSMNIDASAFTPLTAFRGDLGSVDYLRYDITNFAHFLRPNSSVYIIGTGGGRDILSSLVFDQKSILGVEINEDIITIANDIYGDFTGHLDRHPQVRIVNDEARSYLARQQEKFDIIQSSFIDTWAATAAGAFVFTENSLYTVEAWKIFLRHLNPQGVLTFSRWYTETNYALERMTALASAALIQLGIQNPREHILIVRISTEEESRPAGIGTVLVSPRPFSDADLDKAEQVARDMKFDVVLSPRSTIDPIFAQLTTGHDLERCCDNFPVNISPTTDDKPFFFYMMRLGNLLDASYWRSGLASGAYNMAKPIIVLLALLIIVIVLTVLCIIIPLYLTSRKVTVRGSLPLFTFFMAIGFGFMLVEISQMQRLIIFLGHPSYGLSVVLFALLISSGLGSFTTGNVGQPDSLRPALRRFVFLLSVLVIFGLLTSQIIQAFEGSITAVRVLVAILILLPLGLFMGMVFPLGMKIANRQAAPLIPWFWGINGAASVCASVLAVVIALNTSISTSYWIGFACYLAAAMAYYKATRKTAGSNAVQDKIA